MAAFAVGSIDRCNTPSKVADFPPEAGIASGLYEKVGFVGEGVQRRSVLIDGRFSDTVNMALMLDDR